MSKSKKKTVVKATDAQQDKVGTVMSEFKNGKLKDRAGNVVTDKNQALAIALSEAGLSRKSLQKAELISTIAVLKSKVSDYLQKEIARDQGVEQKIVEFFTTNESVNDDMMHKFAERLNISPHELETKVYGLLSSFFRGGKSKGMKTDVDQNELAEGIKVESEHTYNELMARKIAVDHLLEIPDYYTRLKKMEESANVETNKKL